MTNGVISAIDVMAEDIFMKQNNAQNVVEVENKLSPFLSLSQKRDGNINL